MGSWVLVRVMRVQAQLALKAAVSETNCGCFSDSIVFKK